MRGQWVGEERVIQEESEKDSVGKRMRGREREMIQEESEGYSVGELYRKTVRG